MSVASVSDGTVPSFEPTSPSAPLFAPAVEGSRSLVAGGGAGAAGALGGSGGGGGVGSAGSYCAASLLEEARERAVSLRDVLLPAETFVLRRPSGGRAAAR